MSAEEIIKIVEDNLAINMVEGTAHCETPGPRLVKEFLENNYIAIPKVKEVIDKYILTDLQGNPMKECKVLWKIKKELGLMPK